jgi:hypothetical protein
VSAGDAWDAYVTAEQAAHEAVAGCVGHLADGTPEGDRAAFLLDSAELAWSQFEAVAIAGPEVQLWHLVGEFPQAIRKIPGWRLGTR